MWVLFTKAGACRGEGGVSQGRARGGAYCMGRGCRGIGGGGVWAAV